MVRLRRARDIVSRNRMTTGFHPAVGMATMSGMRHDDMVGVSARAIRIGVLDNDPFALDAMCAMISAVSKDFHVMWGTGSPAVAIEHCHNPHTRPDVPVSDPKESVGVAAAHCHSHLRDDWRKRYSLPIH